MHKFGENSKMVNKHLVKQSKKYFSFLLLILIVTGCKNTLTETETEKEIREGQGQGLQYLDGPLPMVYNQSNSKITMPVNVTDYLEQVEIIKKVSPSLYRKNEAVYQAVNQWISENLSTSEFDKLGLKRYQLSGKDNFGNVLLTGYYTPVLKARLTPDDRFRHPLYAKPNSWKGRLPSREDIYKGAFNDHQLELAYTDSMMDNFIMEVQGSGYVDFEDDNGLVFFGYHGKNGHAYKSIGRLLVEQGEIEKEKVSIQAIKAWAEQQDEQTVTNLLIQNPSAIFFKPKYDAAVVGARGVPLVAKASVASDTSVVPSGSVLLVDVPLLGDDGIYRGDRELRLMVALDVGGAIKGQHLDIYQGIGDEAGHQAGYYNHYGRVWVLSDTDLTEQP